MARYSKEHKEKTRQRILDAAAAGFREHGIAGISIPKIMAKVGLTHGDFYSYFDSKDALVSEACSLPLIAAAGRLPAMGAMAPPGEEAQAIVNSYLSSRHRDNATDGCLIPPLAGEISRESSAVRQSFTEALEIYMNELAALMPSASSDESDDAALAMVATMAGGVLLSRAVDDVALSDRILESCRDFCTRAMADKRQ